ncbi:ABC transporter substrate-binding protein [Dongia sp.]|uniref:ABC transporter substrate-binding protein n=1 Tax=Dongia sp. TaxID=1977262 RepID=UPI0035B1ED61
MKKIVFGGAALAAGLFGVVQPVLAEATQYPLTLTNCGEVVTFEKAPGRAVTIGQNSTEILMWLGLSEKIVGTAVWFGKVPPEFEAANAGIPRLADNDPSFESVIARQPELVAAQFEWHVGPNGAVAKRAQFHDLGIPSYVSPADCTAKDNSVGGDGVRVEMFTMDLIYQEITELAAIFDVQDRGAELVRELKAREAAAKAKVAGAAQDITMAFWFSSPEVKGEAYIGGKNGAPAYIMETLGARNVIETQEEWPLVSWETIAGKNPAVLVLGEMDRRRYGADDVNVKIDFLRTDPVARELDAVKQQHWVVLPAQSMSTTIRTIDGIEMLADAIQRFGLVN